VSAPAAPTASSRLGGWRGALPQDGLGTGARIGSLVADAEAAAERGWSVVPLHAVSGGRCSCASPTCRAPGGHPRLAWRASTQQRATPLQIGRWWRCWPASNLGVVTGQVSQLIVLDIDPGRGGDESLAKLVAMHGRLPVTPRSLTGAGSWHLYLRHPARFVPTRPVGPGIDVKADGGLVVAPPSRHVSGRRYGWVLGCTPDEIAPAELPGWLAAMILDQPGSTLGS